MSNCSWKVQLFLESRVSGCEVAAWEEECHNPECLPPLPPPSTQLSLLSMTWCGLQGPAVLVVLPPPLLTSKTQQCCQWFLGHSNMRPAMKKGGTKNVICSGVAQYALAFSSAGVRFLTQVQIVLWTLRVLSCRADLCSVSPHTGLLHEAVLFHLQYLACIFC